MFLPLPRGLQPYVVQGTCQFASPSGRDWISLSRIVQDSSLLSNELAGPCFSARVAVESLNPAMHRWLGGPLPLLLPNTISAGPIATWLQDWVRS